MSVNRIEPEGGSIMRIYVIALLAMVAAVSACAHTTYVDRSDVGECADLSAELAGREALVTLKDGTQSEAMGLLVGPDSTFWLDPRTAELRTVATAEVLEVRIVTRGKGALEGLGVGVLAGAFAGGIIGGVQGNDYTGFIQLTAAQKAGIGAGLGGIGGTLVGAWVGAGTGHRDIYRFEAPPPWEPRR